jgi:hypothetical protein
MDEASVKATQDETELQKRERDHRQAPERLYGQSMPPKCGSNPGMSWKKPWKGAKIGAI